MWKKYIKNINAIIFLVSILCIYRKLLTGLGRDINAYMLLKAGLGLEEAEGISYWLYNYVGKSFKELAAAILMTVIFSVLTAVELFIRKNKKRAHINAIFSAVFGCGFVGYLYINLYKVISSMDEIYSYFSEKMQIGINYLTFFLWIGCYVLVIVLAILGLRYTEEKMIRKEDDIYENKRDSEIRRTKQQNQTVDFHGVILGKKGIYQGMAYLLQEKRKVYVKNDNELLEFSAFEERDAVMEFYYISEYQEYCVEVNEKKTVFLMSGQPLGTNKKYYLPRGTEIYIKDDMNIFELS